MTARNAVHVLREPQGRDGHVKTTGLLRRVRTDLEERFAAHAKLGPDVPRATGQILERERVVTGGHRGMRRKDGACPHLFFRVIERYATRGELTHALDHHERRVTLVGMPRSRLDA